MAKPEEPHAWVTVETYRESGSGLHGDIHVRPIKGQDGFPSTLRVRCPKDMRTYEPGTQFRIWAKMTDREGGRAFLSTYHGWGFEMLGKPK